MGNCQYYESKLSAFLHIMGFWGYDNFRELRASKASKASKDPIIEPSGASSSLHHCRWEQRWGPPGVSLKDRDIPSQNIQNRQPELGIPPAIRPFHCATEHEVNRSFSIKPPSWKRTSAEITRVSRFFSESR